MVVSTLEGQDTTVTATTVDIKKMMGVKIAIESTEGGITTNAIYAADAKLQCLGPGGLTLGSMHGSLAVTTESGGVSVNGLNGGISAKCGSGAIAVHVDALTPGSANRLETGSGEIGLSVSPEVQAWVEITGGVEKEKVSLNVPPGAWDADADSLSGSLTGASNDRMAAAPGRQAQSGTHAPGDGGGHVGRGKVGKINLDGE